MDIRDSLEIKGVGQQGLESVPNAIRRVFGSVGWTGATATRTNGRKGVILSNSDPTRVLYVKFGIADGAAPGTLNATDFHSFVNPGADRLFRVREGVDIFVAFATGAGANVNATEVM